MTDEEFDAMFNGHDPGPESNVRIYALLFGLLVLFWCFVVLAAVAVIG